MGKNINMIGNKFGLLTVVEKVKKSKDGENSWLCKCDCGNQKIILGYSLRSGRTKSCGCISYNRNIDRNLLDNTYQKEDLTKTHLDKKYGRLLVTKFSHKDKKYYYWECLCDCGNIIIIPTGNLGKQVSCGCYKKERIPRGEQHSSWKGGKTINSEGYVDIRINCEVHKEHRYVMEQSLGRKLTSEETVHHIDGNRQNNILSNLELWASRHPKGQRVSDLVKYAKEILSKYEPESLSDKCRDELNAIT